MTVDPAVVVAVISALGAALGRALWFIYSEQRREIAMWREMALRGTALAELAEKKKRD